MMILVINVYITSILKLISHAAAENLAAINAAGLCNLVFIFLLNIDRIMSRVSWS